jgi:hypothetical protein
MLTVTPPKLEPAGLFVSLRHFSEQLQGVFAMPSAVKEKPHRLHADTWIGLTSPHCLHFELVIAQLDRTRRSTFSRVIDWLHKLSRLKTYK